MASDGLFSAKFSGPSGGFFAAALARDDDDGRSLRYRPSRSGGDDDDGPKRASRGKENSSRRDDGVPSKGASQAKGGESKLKNSNDDRIPLGSDRASVSFDAHRNMAKFHLQLGERRDFRPMLPGRFRHERHIGRHERHTESVAWNFGITHAAREPKELTNVHIRGIAPDKEGHTILALDKSLTPVAARYHSSMFERHDAATTVMFKTRLPIGGLSFISNEVLAVGADPKSIERAEALGFRADPVINSEAGDHSIVRFTVPSGLDAVRGQELLSRELPGQRFELNKVYRLFRASAREEPVTLDKSLPATVPGDDATCVANRCFARKAMGWKDTLATCAKGLKVGVIDTDIDESHPAFEGRRIHRFDFAPDGRLPPPNWHGTAVLSLLAGGPLTNTPGLIPDAEFFAANVFYADERGDMAADTISLLKALDWMRAYDVKLINMSFAGPRDGLVADAIERMSEDGVVFVAAAGNEGPNAEPAYPAAYPQVIAVTAVTKELRNYRYANRGYHIDIAAPGVDIWTAAPGRRAGYHSGTSFAAPHVTAVLAVEPPDILKQEKADLLDNLAVMDLGQERRDPIYGRGLLLAPSVCTPPEDDPEEKNEAVASAEPRVQQVIAQMSNSKAPVE